MLEDARHRRNLSLPSTVCPARHADSSYQRPPARDALQYSCAAPRGCRFVDLYAGTGAVGIEAISRGAEHVWFAENAEPALASLRQNLAALKISRGFTLEDRGVGAMLQRLGKLPQPVDIVYLDPPYEAEDEYSGTLNFFGSVRGRAILAPQMRWSSPSTAARRSWPCAMVCSNRRGC